MMVEEIKALPLSYSVGVFGVQVPKSHLYLEKILFLGFSRITE